MYLSFAVLTDVGKKRDHNEDFVTYFHPSNEKELTASGSLFIVADGVGGASQGERASKYAAEKVLYEYYNRPKERPQDRLRRLIQAAGNQINSYAEEGERFMRMATTMVAAVFLDNSLIVANVGDSRAYLIRDGIANQITKDHSFVGEMVRDGFMTEEEARVSKKKNRITRSLGGERDVRVDIFDNIALADGDKILLCSDGFSQYAPKETVATLAQNGTANDIAVRMIAHANAQGGSDNISIILIKVSSSPLEETVSMSRDRMTLPISPIWENQDTDPGIGKQQPKLISKFNSLGIKGKIVLGILPLLLLSFTAILLFSSKNNLVVRPQKSQSTSTSLPASRETTPPPTFAANPGNASIIPTKTILATPSSTQQPSVTGTPTPTSSNNNACQYKYNGTEAGSLSQIVKEIFGDKYANPEYYKKIRCPEQTEENNILCEYNPDNPSYIQLAWTLIYPDIPEEKCKAIGGKPVYLPPANAETDTPENTNATSTPTPTSLN